jgi:hypothetical protein
MRTHNLPPFKRPLQSGLKSLETGATGISAMSCSLHRDVLERRGEREARDQAEGRLADPRTTPLRKASCQIGAYIAFS